MAHPSDSRPEPGFESTLAVLVAVFCGFGVARGAGMEALRHHMRALQLLS